MKKILLLVAAATIIGCTAEPLPTPPAVPGRPKHQTDTLKKGINIVKTSDADTQKDTTKPAKKLQPDHVITLPIYAGE